jgi:hypothetical protein
VGGCTGLTHATDFQTKLIHIIDGDTITALIEAKKKSRFD